MRYYSAEFTLIVCGGVFGWCYSNTIIPTLVSASVFAFVVATQFPQVLRKLRKVIVYLKNKGQTAKSNKLSIHITRAFNFAIIAIISGAIFYFTTLLPEQSGISIEQFPMMNWIRKFSAAVTVGYSLSAIWIYIHAIRLYIRAMMSSSIED